jgi:hypothetical protein
MALNLSVLQKSGVTATYWHVMNMEIDVVHQAIRARIGGYLNQPTQSTGGDPIMVLDITMSAAQFVIIFTAANVFTAFYTQLALDPQFAGSTVVA